MSAAALVLTVTLAGFMIVTLTLAMGAIELFWMLFEML